MKLSVMLSVISLSSFLTVVAMFDPCPGADDCSEFAEGVKSGEIDPRTSSNMIAYYPGSDGKTRFFIFQSKIRAIAEDSFGPPIQVIH